MNDTLKKPTDGRSLADYIPESTEVDKEHLLGELSAIGGAELSDIVRPVKPSELKAGQLAVESLAPHDPWAELERVANAASVHVAETTGTREHASHN